MKGAADVVIADLEYICQNASDELAEMAGTRVLVSGGGGFLGYYLVQAVLHWNRLNQSAPPIRVTIADSFILGTPAWLGELVGDSALRVVRHDVTIPLPTEVGDFEYVAHAASIASPVYYRRYPIETMDANVDGLRRMLDRARGQTARGVPVRGFLFFSSSEVYGDPDPAHIPTPEEYRGNVSCTGPRACYDEAKRYGETVCVAFANAYGLPVKIVRPFNNYGPGMKLTDGRVVADLTRNVLRRENVILRSDGSPTRTFCYVADAIVGYYKVLVRGRTAQPYNIGVSAPEISVRELGERIVALARDLYGYRGKVVCTASDDPGYLTDSPRRRCPSIEKARRELDYQPAIPLDEGLKRTLVWFSEQRAAEPVRP
ncbi:MAG: NAD-dependent epimerase/dehydratase family protein [Armatimonadota bacterium]|nr:NAD-dependent epimerase/dehydratase family protein [Armatimonadota bacterium]